MQAKGDIREILDRLAEKAWRDGARRHGRQDLDPPRSLCRLV
jgi:hypothetical protein